MTRDEGAMNRANYGGTLLQLLRPFLPITLAATLLGIAGGLCTAWLLSVINASLHAPGGIGMNTAMTFIALCIVTLLCNGIAGIGNSVTGQRIIAALRKDISARIVCAPVAALERYKTHQIGRAHV